MNSKSMFYRKPTLLDFLFIVVFFIVMSIVSYFAGDGGEGKEQLPRLRSEYNLILRDIQRTYETEDYKQNHFSRIIIEVPETHENIPVLSLLQQRLELNHWRFATKINDSSMYCKDDLMLELLPPSHNSQEVKGGDTLRQQIDMIIIEIQWGRGYTSEICTPQLLLLDQN